MPRGAHEEERLDHIGESFRLARNCAASIGEGGEVGNLVGEAGS